jgi:hypothetical protein
MELQNDVGKNSLWRSSTIITPRSGGLGTRKNKGKSPMTQPTFKRHQPIIYGQDNVGSHGSFGGNGSKGTFNNKKQHEQSKYAQADFTRRTKSTTFD